MEWKVGTANDFVKKSVGTNTLQHKNQVSLADIKSHGLPIVLLVDADIVAYRCSATTDGRTYTVKYHHAKKNKEQTKTFQYKKDAVTFCNKTGADVEKDLELTYTPEPAQNAHANVDKLLRALKRDTGAQSMELYLTPDMLFRKEYMSDYKANRRGVRKPANLVSAKSHMTVNYKAEQVDGYEADDLLAIRARQLIEEGKYTPIICSLDKDLDMISCYHYQWTKKALYFVTPNEGTLAFYGQLLTGDAVDNIPGIKGVGPKTAAKWLDGLDGSSSFDCYSKVLQAYMELTPRETDEESGEVESDEDFTIRIVKMITRNGRLLYILHKMGEVWYPPVATDSGVNNTEEPKEAE